MKNPPTGTLDILFREYMLRKSLNQTKSEFVCIFLNALWQGGVSWEEHKGWLHLLGSELFACDEQTGLQWDLPAL